MLNIWKQRRGRKVETAKMSAKYYFDKVSLSIPRELMRTRAWKVKTEKKIRKKTEIENESRHDIFSEYKKLSTKYIKVENNHSWL